MSDETLANAFHGIVEGLCVSAGIEARSIRHRASEHLEIRLFNQTLALKTVYLDLDSAMPGIFWNESDVDVSALCSCLDSKASKVHTSGKSNSLSKWQPATQEPPPL